MSAAPACPRCGRPTAQKKARNGSLFWSCTGYPTCHGAVNITPANGDTPEAQGPPPPIGVPPGATPVPWGMISESGFALDDHQRRVVDWRRGTLVVAAAAGSGKSTVLVERTLALLREGYIPESICVLVYNKDAAKSLRERLSARGGYGAGRVNAFTFHAWCYALLRHWYPNDERLAPRHIIDTPGAPSAAKAASILIETMKLKDADVRWGPAVQLADQASESLIDVASKAAIPALARMRGAIWLPNTPCPPEVVKDTLPWQRFCVAWREYKRKENLLSFSDLMYEVGHAIRTMADTPHVAHLAQMYQWVMVDEAQDSNAARFTIARWLGGAAEGQHDTSRLLMVGDVRQSIYAFAGATPDLLLGLLREDGVTMTTLPVNRRSVATIVSASNQIADGQDWNVGGACVPRADAASGEAVQVWVTDTEAEESAEIIRDIERRVSVGWPMAQPDRTPTFCILARTNAMLIDLECAFVARGVPVRVTGEPGGVWASSVGKQLLSYLEAIAGRPSWGLLDVANIPNRYAKRADLADVIRAQDLRVKDKLPATLFHALRTHGSKGLARLSADLQDAARLSWPEQCLTAARWLGFADDEDEDLDSGDRDRAGALRALMTAAAKLGSVQAILDSKAAQGKRESEPAVLLSTLHRAKGLEWPVVYVAGARVGKLPHKRAESIDEERRLFYVGVTRGKHAVIVSTGGKPSRFLIELGWAEDPEEYAAGAKDDLDAEGYL